MNLMESKGTISRRFEFIDGKQKVGHKLARSAGYYRIELICYNSVLKANAQKTVPYPV